MKSHKQNSNVKPDMNIIIPLVDNDQISDDNACNAFDVTSLDNPEVNLSTNVTRRKSSSKEMTSVNAFSFMMSNRHKQNEVIKKMAEEEKLREESVGYACVEDSFTPSKNCVTLPTNLRETDNSLTFSPQSAFSLLMPSSEKLELLQKEKRDDPDYNPFEEVLAKKSKHSKKSHKRLIKILDSSLEDFEELFSSYESKKSATSVKDRNIIIRSKSFESDTSTGDEASPMSLNRSNASCSSKIDKKLDLVNDEEIPCLEDTFRDEILECVGSKKKTKKKKSKIDTETSKPKSKIPISSIAPSIIPKEYPNPKKGAIVNHHNTKFEKEEQGLPIQPGILNYFKQVVPNKFEANRFQSVVVSAEIHSSKSPLKKLRTPSIPNKNSLTMLKRFKQIKTDNFEDLDAICIENSGEEPVKHIFSDQFQDNSSIPSSTIQYIEYNGTKIEEKIQNDLKVGNQASLNEYESLKHISIEDILNDTNKEIFDNKEKQNAFSLLFSKKKASRITSSLRSFRKSAGGCNDQSTALCKNHSNIDSVDFISGEVELIAFPEIKSFTKKSISDSKKEYIGKESDEISLPSKSSTTKTPKPNNVFSLMMNNRSKQNDTKVITESDELKESKNIASCLSMIPSIPPKYSSKFCNNLLQDSVENSNNNLKKHHLPSKELNCEIISNLATSPLEEIKIADLKNLAIGGEKGEEIGEKANSSNILLSLLNDRHKQNIIKQIEDFTCSSAEMPKFQNFNRRTSIKSIENPYCLSLKKEIDSNLPLSSGEESSVHSNSKKLSKKNKKKPAKLNFFSPQDDTDLNGDSFQDPDFDNKVKCMQSLNKNPYSSDKSSLKFKNSSQGKLNKKKMDLAISSVDFQESPTFSNDERSSKSKKICKKIPEKLVTETKLDIQFNLSCNNLEDLSNVSNTEYSNPSFNSVTQDNSERAPLRRSSRKIKKIEHFGSSDVSPSLLRALRKSMEQPSIKASKNFSFPAPESNEDSEKENDISLKSYKSRKKQMCFQKIPKNVLSRKSQKQACSATEQEKVSDLVILESFSKSTLMQSRVKRNDDKKLAPIFISKDSQNEPILSPSKLKARRDFLFSQTPDELKKCSPAQKIEIYDVWPCFPTESHITQLTKDSEFDQSVSSISKFMDEFLFEVPDLRLSPPCDDHFILIEKGDGYSPSDIQIPPSLSVSTLCHILYHLKNKNISFPVYNVFKGYLDGKEEAVKLYVRELESNKTGNNLDLLKETPSQNKKRKKKGKKMSTNKRRRLCNNFTQNIKSNLDIEEYTDGLPTWHHWVPFGWNQIFAPKSSSNVIGNSGLVCQLKQWLQDWKKNIELQTSKDKQMHFKRDDDSNSVDSDDGLVNTLLLNGPSGVGKTCIIYALAQELGFEVMEVNASSRRTGKQVMSQLSEATQSHIVSSGSSFSGISSGATLGGVNKESDKKEKKQQSCILTQGNRLTSQNSVEAVAENERKKNMALILFKDIDIVYEDSDEGFFSAVNSFIATTKRPIILTTSTPTQFTISKIKGIYSELTFNRPDPAEVAQYLQLMCLAANGIFPSANEVEALVASNKGDIRKTVQDLQFWALSGSTKIQWFKMYPKSLSMSNRLSNTYGDINLTDIFPNFSLKKSVDIPITLGCCWSRSDLGQLKENRHIGSNWMLVSGNASSLLPFNLKLSEKLHPKFPYKENDPEVLKSSVYQRHSWLALQSGDEEETIPSEKQNQVAELTEKALPPEIQKTISTCIHSLSTFFGDLADIDILSYKNNSTSENCSDLNNWWQSLVTSDLECTTDKYEPTPNFTSIGSSSDLSSSIAILSYKMTQKRIRNSLKNADSKEEWSSLTISVESIPPSLFLHPHQHASLSRCQHTSTISHKVASYLPVHLKPQRGAITKDVLPYIRAFSRADQLGEAVQRLRRSRRFLSHMSQIGFYLLPHELMELCNFFLN